MQVTINGKIRDLPEEMTILQMIRHLELSESSGIAVAKNSTVISSNHFSKTPVKEGDKLEIIHATSGG